MSKIIIKIFTKLIQVAHEQDQFTSPVDSYTAKLSVVTISITHYCLRLSIKQIF